MTLILLFSDNSMARSISARGTSNIAGLYRDAALSRMTAERLELRTEEQQKEEQMTTWGRIKRSSDSTQFDDPEESNRGAPKSNSLPNLTQSRDGAGENLIESVENVPIFDLATSMHSSQRYRSCVDSSSKSKSPVSLLKAFQSKHSLGGATNEEMESSGYGTNDANANDNQSPQFLPDPSRVDDYDYAEFYLGNGRYIDVNHNEIGFVPPSTAGVQRSGATIIAPLARMDIDSPRDRWAALAPNIARVAPAKPPRTFATLLESPLCDDLSEPRQRSNNERGEVDWKKVNEPLSTSICAPDLSFLKMEHNIPALFPDMQPFPVAFLTSENPALEDLEIIELAAAGKLKNGNGERKEGVLGVDGSLTDNEMLAASWLKRPLTNPNFLLANDPEKLAIESLQPPPLLHQAKPAISTDAQNMLTNLILNQNQTNLPSGLAPPSEFSLAAPKISPSTTMTNSTGIPRDRDSGLGSSGPAHIQDWESLALLLPRNVAHACSFFKANSQLLGRSSQGSADGNSIERPGCSRRFRSEPGYGRVGRQKSRFECIREEGAESGGCCTNAANKR